MLSIIPWLLVLQGCGFVLHGDRQDITFDSKPPGVAVTLDGATQFVTPHTVPISRATRHQAMFQKNGYEAKQVVLTPKFLIGPSIIGNILPLFPVGLAIDIMTGSAWGFEQDYLAVDMIKSEAHP